MTILYVYVRTCGVETTLQMKVEMAEERKSSMGFRMWCGISLLREDWAANFANCVFVVYWIDINNEHNIIHKILT